MISEFDRWGSRLALTVIKVVFHHRILAEIEEENIPLLQVDSCEVVQQKTFGKDGYTALQLGVCEAKVKNLTKPLLGHFAAGGVAPKRKLGEFRVSPEALMPVGKTTDVQGQAWSLTVSPHAVQVPRFWHRTLSPGSSWTCVGQVRERAFRWIKQLCPVKQMEQTP